MAEKSLYRSPEGKRIILELYDKALELLGIEYESKFVSTRFGPTHVLIAGPKEAKPLIALHGGNSFTPHLMKGLTSMIMQFRVYGVDLIGHPGRSAETKLSHKKNEYGLWLIDVLDGLSLEKAPFIGGSFSAGVVFQLASVAPERISKVSMIVPSGIANGSSLDKLFKLVIPWLKYRIKPNRKRLITLTRLLMSEFDEDLIDLIEADFKHVKIHISMPHPLKEEELKKFEAPTMIFAAKEDILFPANKVIPRAKKIIPNLVAAEYIDGLHGPTNEIREYFIKRSLEFFKEAE
ncbi:MAG: alpha/beta fold hydrolase [Candidatus Hodarchaeales archaeon]